MAIFADVANRSKTNSLRMARPSRHDNPPMRKLKAKIKKIVVKSRRDTAYAQRAAARAKAKAKPVNPFANKYNVQAIQSQRGQTVNTVRGNVQTDWMRWRGTENAILNLLSPEARKRVEDANVKIDITGPTGQAQYSPFDLPEFMADVDKTVTIRSGMQADDIRHELTHAGLDVASDMFSNVEPLNVFANTALGTFMGQNNIIWNQGAQMEAAESPAITMGGQAAYPGFTPSNNPEDFSQFFNTEHPSWQYDKPKWNIGK